MCGKITLSKSSHYMLNVNFVLTFCNCFVFNLLRKLCLVKVECLHIISRDHLVGNTKNMVLGVW